MPFLQFGPSTYSNRSELLFTNAAAASFQKVPRSLFPVSEMTL
jgi:hypothetical protein